MFLFVRSQIHPKYYHFKSGLNVSVCTFVFVFRLRSCTVFFALQALLNLGTSDPSLRLAAYNLLCSVTKSFNLKIEERLLEGTGKDINAAKTPVINHNTKFWWSCTVSNCLCVAENINLWLRKLSLVFGESLLVKWRYMEFNCLILRSKLNADNPSRASTSLYQT